jgi:hypothetical protein
MKLEQKYRDGLLEVDISFRYVSYYSALRVMQMCF